MRGTVTGEAIKATREALRLSQSELASAIGTTKTSIYRMESGRMPIRLTAQMAIECLLWRAGMLTADNPVSSDETSLINQG